MISKRQNEIGWREWVSLPKLHIDALKAKIDTGARTSTLHAFKLETCRRSGVTCVRFSVHPLQRNNRFVVESEARVIDLRKITDSGGHTEERYVINTPITIGDQTWDIELTLTNRDSMRFRMLLSRSALRGRFLVNPGRSFILSDRYKR